MYAISSDNARRPSQTGPERPELPILFHLFDVSRSRPAAGDALLAEATAERAKAAEPVSLATTATQPFSAAPADSTTFRMQAIAGACAACCKCRVAAHSGASSRYARGAHRRSY